MDYVMTDEKRQELLGLLPFSVAEKLEYMPKVYLSKTTSEDGVDTYLVPEELRPTFVLRPMTRKEIDALRTRQRQKKIDDDGLYDMIASAIVGWHNLYDIGTKPPTEIPYKADAAGGCDKNLIRSSVPVPVAIDLGVCIIRMNGLVGAEYLGFQS